MTQIRVKPADGRTVKLPGLPKHRNTVPAQGWLVQHSVFIQRRLNHGDLIAVADAPTSPAAAGLTPAAGEGSARKGAA